MKKMIFVSIVVAVLVSASSLWVRGSRAAGVIYAGKPTPTPTPTPAPPRSPDTPTPSLVPPPTLPPTPTSTPPPPPTPTSTPTSTPTPTPTSTPTPTAAVEMSEGMLAGSVQVGYAHPITVAHTLTNTGNYTDTATLTASGDWLTGYEPVSVTLSAGQATTVSLYAQVSGYPVSGTVGLLWLTATSEISTAVHATITDTITFQLQASDDSDNDGFSDLAEGDGDPDGDGIPNYLDTDSDGDGFSDLAEGDGDPDGDGIPNYLDTDSDGSGVDDGTDGDGDNDSDGVPDYLDTDDDNDGVLDGDEAADSDGDGIPDQIESNIQDTDADYTADYLDTDSDGDGIPDADEGTTDSDGDGIPAYLDADESEGGGDSDGDGIPDVAEASRGAYTDSDGDTIPDWMDLDSNNDGLPDAGAPEFAGYDFDFPGWPDLPPPPSYFPDHITCPSYPALQALTFPSTLGLPDMPTLTLMSYITEVVSPIVDLTEAIMNWDAIIDSSLIMPQGIAAAAGFGTDDFGEAGGSPTMDISIGGYTASGLATELVTGMDTFLSYLRGVESIGVIGPTVAGLVVGISWITFVALVKIVLKPLMLVIHLVLEIWRLLPFT